MFTAEVSHSDEPGSGRIVSRSEDVVTYLGGDRGPCRRDAKQTRGEHLPVAFHVVHPDTYSQRMHMSRGYLCGTQTHT